MSSHSINAFPGNPLSRSKRIGKSLINQKLANQKTVRFAGGCCGGNADNALPPLRESPSKQDAFHQQQAQQSSATHAPTGRENGFSTRSEKAKNASTQTSPLPTEPAPLSPENTPDVKPAEPEPSVWQKVANWLKQFIEILFVDLEALFSGKKTKSSQPSCASAAPKTETPPATDTHCSISQKPSPEHHTGSACH